MKIYEEKRKGSGSWALKLEKGNYVNIVSLVAVDSETGERVCSLMHFDTDGLIRCGENALSDLECIAIHEDECMYCFRIDPGIGFGVVTYIADRYGEGIAIFDAAFYRHPLIITGSQCILNNGIADVKSI